MASEPVVSVVIPCFNGERFVGQAVESALGQTRPALEVIVVDDGSTDGSAEVVARYGGQVRLIRQDNRGRAGAVATGVQAARGELIALLDADDLWVPQKLEWQVGALVGQRAGLTYGLAVRCDENGRELPVRLGAPARRWALPQMLCGNLVCGNTVIVRRSVWDRVGGFVGRYWPCDDYHLWLRIAAAEPFAYVDEVLAHYRSHGQQVSHDRVVMIRQEMAVIRGFLAERPDVLRALSAQLVRRACAERFIDRGIHYYRIGRQAVARAVLRECLKRWPGRARVLRYALLSHLPWSWYARLHVGDSAAR